MAEYFVPLKTLVPATVKLADIPFIGPALDLAISNIGIRDFTESWNDTHVTSEGTAVVNGELMLPLGGGAAFILGQVDQVTTFEFVTAEERRSMIRTAIESGMEAIVGEAGTEEDVDLDPTTKTFLQLDWLAERSRTTISGVGLKLRLPPKHVKKGEAVTNANGDEIVGVNRLPTDEPVDIQFASVLITYDSNEGFSFSIPADEVVVVPPFFIGDSDFAIVAEDVKVDYSLTEGIAEVLSRPGYDERWQGVYFKTFALYGLDSVCGMFPSRIGGSNWICSSEGWSGSLYQDGPQAKGDETWQVGKIEIEFDRGSLVRGTFGAVFRVGSLDTSLASFGSDDKLEFEFTLRHNPSLSGLAAWSFDAAILTPGTKDKGLLTIKKELLQPLLTVLAAVAAGAALVDEAAVLGPLLIIAAAALMGKGVITPEFLRLDAIRFRSLTEPVLNDVVRYIDLVFDVQTALSLDIDIPIVLTAKTQKPIGVDLKGLTLRWAANYESLQDATKEEVSRFAFGFDPESGVSFDLSEQQLIESSMLEIFQFGVGKWEQGLWFDVGVRVSQQMSSTGSGGAAARLYFNMDGELVDAALQGIDFTVFLPEVIYCRASLGWGVVKQIDTHALLIGTGQASSAPVDPNDPLGQMRAYMKRSAWMWEVHVFLQTEELPGGETALLAGLDLNISTGIPLGGSGVSLFGLLGLYASNKKPNVPGGDYLKWYAQTDPKNQIVSANKWQNALGDWGIGVGVVLGSTLDLGRTWNGKFGVMLLLPGPVIAIFGSANLLKAKPNVGDAEGAAFTALIVLDLEEDTLTLGLIIKYNIPDPDGKLVRVTVPVEIFVDFNGGGGFFHLYLGKHMPISERITAEVLGLLNISGYLMFDTKAIDNLAGNADVDIPPFAIAFGGKAEWITGLKAGPIQCYFFAGIEFHLAVGMPDPWVFYGTLHLRGGLVVKVFGFGFDFEVWAKLTASAPSPYRVYGEVGIKIGLPWPLPDIDESIELTLIDEASSPPPPESANGALTIHAQHGPEPSVVEPEATAAAPVAIDPILSLAFRFPMNSANGAVGSLHVAQALQNTTYERPGTYELPGGNSYRFDLIDVTLWNATKQKGHTNVPALWRIEPVRAPGDQEARMVLDLFAFKSSPTSRYIGGAAEYMNELLKEWTPCKPVTQVKPVCYFLGDEATGLLGTRTLTEAGHALIVTTAPPPPNAGLLKAVFGLVTTRAEITDVAGVRAVRVPGTFGWWMGESQDTLASETLVLELDRARDLDLRCIAPQRRGANVRVTFYDGFVPVHTADGTPGADADAQYRWLTFHYAGPVTRIELVQWNESVLSIGGVQSHAPLHDVHFHDLCAVYEADVLVNQQNAASNVAWTKFWSDLIDQKASTSDALLLEPGCHYELTTTVQWTFLGDGDGDIDTKTYRFETTAAAEKPRPLVKRNPQLFEDQDPWEVDALPSDGTFAMYLDRPIRLRFSDPRIEAVYGKFEQKLVLRLIDDQGVDLFQRLKVLEETATSLPEYEQLWIEKVTNAPCTPDGVELLWNMGYALFDTILERKRRYSATLHVVPLSLSELDLESAQWSALPVVFDFQFNTSRWKNATEHAAAQAANLRDELLDAAVDVASIESSHGDDQRLDAVLFDTLGLPFRKPPDVPETVVLWRPTAGGAYEPVGILLDGPEPLLRDPKSMLFYGLIPVRRVTGASRARVLLLFQQPPGSGPLLLTLTDVFTDENGNEATESAPIAISIPAVSSVFAKEPAP